MLLRGILKISDPTTKDTREANKVAEVLKVC